ncbi:hypothetical protein Z043_107253, partial [Scleropages formosus]
VLHQDEKAEQGNEGNILDAQPPASVHCYQDLLIKVHTGKPAKGYSGLACPHPSPGMGLVHCITSLPGHGPTHQHMPELNIPLSNDFTCVAQPAPVALQIERIELKGVIQKNEKPTEYSFEVLWSDSIVSLVSRTCQEVMEFLSKLTQLFPEDENFSRPSPSSSLDSAFQPDPRCLTKLPQHLLKHDQVRQFFSSTLAAQFTPSANFGCPLQYRGASGLPRPVCGVASIQPVISTQCSIQPHSATSFPSSGGVPAIGDCTTPLNPPPLNPAPQPSSEQNGILDWLRKLRLHKYYPVFKQLTMEKFLALTEEDLNKYDLTQGAKKKLKTQLELQKVTPSNHADPMAPIHAVRNAELRVDVEGSSHTHPRDSGSSSGYSSSPSSPMAPRDESFERVKDPRRRVELGSESGDRDRSCVTLNNMVPTGSCRPTAQVLPVQNDPSSSLSPYHLPPPVLPLLSPGHDRTKPLCSGVAVGVQLENRFPGLSLEMPPALLQDASSSASSSALQGSITALRSPPGLMVETSTAPTATSNTLHHVSRPPLQPQLSPSLPPASPHRVGHFSSSWSTFPPVSSVPMATLPENTYCVKSTSVAPPLSSLSVIAGHNTAPASSSPVSTETGLGGVSTQPSVCVCSSCGCSGNCGSYTGLPANYAGYFQHPFSGPSVFTLGPLLHLSPLMTGPHPQQHSVTASPFSYPLAAPPLYSSSLPHETQPGLILPPMQGYLGTGAAAGLASPVTSSQGASLCSPLPYLVIRCDLLHSESGGAESAGRSQAPPHKRRDWICSQ